MTESLGNRAKILRSRSHRAVVIVAIAGGLLFGSVPATAAPISAFRSYLAAGPGHWATTPLMEVPTGVHVRNDRGQLKSNRVVEYVSWVRAHNPVVFDHRHPILGPMIDETQEVRGANFATHAATSARANRAETILSLATRASQAAPTVTTTQAQIIEAPHKTTIVLPHVALEQLDPVTIPASGSVASPIVQEISTSSVVSSNVFPPQAQALEGSPAAIPEPSTLALALTLFGAAACWGRRRSTTLS